MDVLSWSRHHRLFPGEGAFDLAAFVGHVLSTGYYGPLSLEVFNDTFRQTDVARTAAHALRSLVWLEDQVAQRQAAGRSPAAVGGGGLVRLPRTPSPPGSTSSRSRRRTPAPSSSRWASSASPSAGSTAPSPYGSGPRARPEWSSTSSTPATSSRTSRRWGSTSQISTARWPAPRLYKLRRCTGGRTPGEVALEAVRAPDGTEIFLCPSPADGVEPEWTAEFEHGVTAPGGSGAVPPARIDHVNLVQRWQEFDEAVLFYTSVLGLDASVAVEVAGPTGLVRSQVMRTADGSIRVPLNVAPPVLETSGLPQHIAFSTDRIDDLAREARDRGLEFLTVPDNYYDDLVARFDLAPETVAHLRELGLLYDREADGEFVHFYTATVGEVFFEVVQRHGGYDGYGAGNAPVRLAAQRSWAQGSQPRAK